MNTTFQGNTTKINDDEWFTPPEIIKALGSFDLDPCSSVKRPWNTAKKHFTLEDNGLLQVWAGRVWCNPPYGKETAYWLNRCAMHGNATALTFARTDTEMFFRCVWDIATAVLFIKGRLHFYRKNGVKSNINAGSPSVLIAYDEYNAGLLKTSGIKGKFILLR